MSEKTPAQQFRNHYHQALALAREREQLEARVAKIREEVRRLESEAEQLARAEIGLEKDDLVVDEMGVVYRLDSVSPKSLNWSYDRRDSVATLTAATSEFYVRGIALYANGLPRWKDNRTIRGKIRKYDPETGMEMEAGE